MNLSICSLAFLGFFLLFAFKICYLIWFCIWGSYWTLVYDSYSSILWRCLICDQVMCGYNWMIESFLFSCCISKLRIDFFSIWWIKLEDGEIVEDYVPAKDVEKQPGEEVEDIGANLQSQSDRKPSDIQQSGWSRRDINQRLGKRVNIISYYVAYMFSCGYKLLFFHYISVVRRLAFLLRSMFHGCCQRMRILNWLAEIKECLGNS